MDFSDLLLVALAFVISAAQIDQGRKNKKASDVSNVSVRIPLAVIVAQAIYFLKGMVRPERPDWGMIAAAIIIVCGAAYNLYWYLRKNSEPA